MTSPSPRKSSLIFAPLKGCTVGTVLIRSGKVQTKSEIVWIPASCNFSIEGEVFVTRAVSRLPQELSLFVYNFLDLITKITLRGFYYNFVAFFFANQCLGKR